MWPREIDIHLALTNLLKSYRAEELRCAQEARELQTNQAVYNHFMAMKIAYGHCANNLEKILKDLYLKKEDDDGLGHHRLQSDTLPA